MLGLQNMHVFGVFGKSVDFDALYRSSRMGKL